MNVLAEPASGGARRPVTQPPREAAALAIEASSALGTLLGADLLPDGRGRWTVLELNGAVELMRGYAPWGDVLVEAVSALAQAAFDHAMLCPPVAAETA
jgi:glutathione synthase/RimK-type ligase-like ATP-grasp enzyme